MKILSKEVYDQIRKWVYRSARYVEITWWEYFFENGTAEAVVDALAYYQNADGGFGNGLEPDCSNPGSSPATTYMAYTRLLSVGCDEKQHPMIQGIMKYIENTEYFTEHGWYWSIPSNREYPCQPWYEFPNAPWFPKDWPPENYVNGSLIAFILKYFDKEHEIYQKALRVIDYRISLMETYREFCSFTGEWNQESIEANDWVTLLEAMEEYGIRSSEECGRLKKRFMKIVDAAAIPEVRLEIRRRLEKRDYTEEELDSMADNLSHGKKWNEGGLICDSSVGKKEPIYSISELWWNLINAVEDLRTLRRYGRLEENCE